MTFVDANYFLSAVVDPTPETAAMHQIATDLFRSVAHGEEDATTSEAVIAEVTFVLNSKRQYGLPPAEIAAKLRPILRLPGLVLPTDREELYLRALDLWTERPRLGFVDALTVAELEQTGMRLATFDGDFDAFPGLVHRRPPGEGETD